MDATSTITVKDLVSLSQNVAQLNLGYLGISVAILGVLGGVFVYFNIRPLKEALDKQEKATEDLKKEAQSLLSQASVQSEKILRDFKEKQEVILNTVLKQQEDKLKLESINKIQEVEKSLISKIDSVSEAKDTKLKEIILAETINKVSTLENVLKNEISETKKITDKDLLKTQSTISSLGIRVDGMDERVKELLVYKFSKEGKMGAVIYSIELLESAINENLNLKKLGIKESTRTWKVDKRIGELTAEIGDSKIEDEYVAKIKVLLDKVDTEETLKEKITLIKLKLNIK